MIQEENKNCSKHGITLHRLYKSGGKERWRCLKCQTEATQKRRDKVKVMSVAYKGGKCQVCGYDKYIGALEFHHVNPEGKDFGISSKGYTHSWIRLKKKSGNVFQYVLIVTEKYMLEYDPVQVS